MRVAYLGPPGTFNDDALRAAAAGGADVERGRRADGLRRDPRRRERRRRARAGPVRELDRGLGAHDARHARARSRPSVAIVGEHDHPIRHSLIARTRARRSRRSTAVLSHPQAQRPVRALHPRAAAGRRRCARRPSTADAVRQVAESDEPWAALGAALGGASCTAARCSPRAVEDEPDNVTRFVWIAPQRHASRRRRAVADDARLLRARRRPSRRPRRGAARVLRPRGQPDADRVAATAPRAGPLHVLHRLDGRRATIRRSPRRSRGCATRPSRCGMLGSYPVARSRDSALAQAVQRPLSRTGNHAGDDGPGTGAPGRNTVAGSTGSRRPSAARAGPQRDVSSRSTSARCAAPTVLVLKSKAEILEHGKRPAALRAPRARRPGRDPADHLRHASRATSTAARSPARRCWRATRGRASTAARPSPG